MLAKVPNFDFSPEGRARIRNTLTPPSYVAYLVFMMLILALIVQYLFALADGHGPHGDDEVEAGPVSIAPVEFTVSGHISQFVQEWPGKTGLSEYPSSFTRGVEPKPIHSHNDYWQKVPFYQGLSVGAVSTEADVWARDGDLLVGHEQTALDPKRTFRSLYVDPIVEVLEKQNPTTQFSNNTRCGPFDESCFQTLYLWVDLKTGVKETWPLVAAQLAPLRERNWLTKWDGKIIIPGPVTVIGTGSSNWEVLIANKTRERDYFVDAPLLKIGAESEQMHADGKTPLYDSSSSPFATTSLIAAVGPIKGELSEKQLKKVEKLVKIAKERGILTRFWETPNWSTRRRHNIWRQLADIPVGLLNVDDLEDAAYGDW
ncbi:Altered inheritance of mitochondria protein 6 [Orbilia blumenaviensis]|uniref:Altered inheritance of mitochondria protein 6 n=1 Tax=Orbilia blumenaviensis TaxID=1796055 RepID=A0AAV9VNA2_9PEZI